MDQITIQLKDIKCIKKEKTAKVIPNAIQVCTDTEKVRGTLRPAGEVSQGM